MVNHLMKKDKVYEESVSEKSGSEKQLILF